MKSFKIVSLLFLISCVSVLFGSLAFADVKWVLGGAVITGYNDNISYSDTNRIGDMVTHTSLNGGVTQTGPNDVFDFKTGITENIYTNHPSLDNLSENLSTDYTGDLNAYEHIKAADIFSHSVDPSSLENAFGRINGSYETYYNSLDLESKTDFTEEWSGKIKYMQKNYNFTSQSLSDSAGYNPEISTEYDFSSSSQGTLKYDNRLQIFNPGKSSDANTPSAGWRQYLNSQWYVDLLAGVDFIKGFGEDLTKPRYAAGITNDVDPNTQLTLKYDKQYETDPYTQDIANDWHLTLNGFHQFTERINGDISLYTGESKYVEFGILDKFIGTNVSFQYMLNQYVNLTLTYALQDSISESAIRASIQNTIFAGVTFKI